MSDYRLEERCPDEEIPPVKINYCPGDTLPDHLSQNITVPTPGGDVLLTGGMVIPPDALIVGVSVDETADCPIVIPLPVEPPAPVVPEEELFTPGQILPDCLTAPIQVQRPDGTFVTVSGGDVVPTIPGLEGIFVDETDCTAVCIFKAGNRYFQYVEHDPAVHIPGGIVGSGTSPSDPIQIPIVRQVRELFTEGSTLPDNMVGPITLPDGSVVNPGDPVPAIDGLEGVYVDEVTGEAACLFKPSFEYVVLDPGVHQVGPAIDNGVGTSPYQIPLPTAILDKDGNPLENGDRVAQYSDFSAAGRPSIQASNDLLMGQDAAGNCVLFQPPEIEQDQKICAVRIVNTPAGGQNVYSFEYDVCDIDGNVVNTLVANDVPIPTFVDKLGNALTGEIPIMLDANFVADGDPIDTTDLVYVQTADGDCVKRVLPAVVAPPDVECCEPPITVLSLTDTNDDGVWDLSLATSGGAGDVFAMRITDAQTGVEVYPLTQTPFGSAVTLPDGSPWTVGSAGTFDANAYLASAGLSCEDLKFEVYCLDSARNDIPGPVSTVDISIGCLDSPTVVNQAAVSLTDLTDVELGAITKGGGGVLTANIAPLTYGETTGATIAANDNPFNGADPNPIVTPVAVTNTNGILYVNAFWISINGDISVGTPTHNIPNVGAFTRIDLDCVGNPNHSALRKGSLFWAPVTGAGSGAISVPFVNLGTASDPNGAALWQVGQIDNVSGTSPFIQQAGTYSQGSAGAGSFVFPQGLAGDCAVFGVDGLGHVDGGTTTIGPNDNAAANTNLTVTGIAHAAGLASGYQQRCNLGVDTFFEASPTTGATTFNFQKDVANTTAAKNQGCYGFFELNCLPSAGGSGEIVETVQACVAPPCAGGAGGTFDANWFFDSGQIEMVQAPTSDFEVSLTIGGTPMGSLRPGAGVDLTTPGIQKGGYELAIAPLTARCVDAEIKIICHSYDSSDTNTITFGNGVFNIHTL